MNEPKKYGPRIGSRPWKLMQLEPGEAMLLQAPKDQPLQSFMQNIASDITRNGLKGQVRQSLILGIEVATREVHEIVKVYREPEPEPPPTKGKKAK